MVMPMAVRSFPRICQSSPHRQNNELTLRFSDS
jgi:hypothetical protein